MAWPLAPSVDHSVARLITESPVRSIGRSLDRLVVRSLGWSIDRSVACPITRSLGRSLGCLSEDRLIVRSVDRLITRGLEQSSAENSPSVARRMAGVTAARHTPVVRSCRHGNLKRMLELLEAGQSLDDQDDSGRTALHHAAAKGNVVAASWLIAYGCSTNILDASGYFAFELVFFAGHIELAKFLLLCNFHETGGKALSPVTLALATEDCKCYCILIDTTLPLQCRTESEFKDVVKSWGGLLIIIWSFGSKVNSCLRG